MDRISFDIYIPDGKKFHWTPDLIVFGSWFIAISFCWAIDGIVSNSGDYRGYVALIVGIITFYYLITSFFTYKSLNGKFDREIIFNEDDFIIGDTIYHLNDINYIDFFFGDYYGQSSTNGRSFNPKLYQGVNNYISFTDKNNIDYQVYFKLPNKHSYLSLAPFINHVIKFKKMSFNRGIELLGIENVSIN